MAMTMEELEAEVMRLKKQEAEWNRTKDYIAIWKLNSLYSHMIQVPAKTPEIVDLFAKKTPGVIIEIGDGGVYEGPNAAKTVFAGIWAKAKDLVGGMAVHYHVNPVIEINKEGTKARGIWHSPGLFTAPCGEEGKMKTIWEWGVYDIDYVKEDGEWKFWKFVWRMTFMCRFINGPGEDTHHVSQDFQIEFTPDKPCTYHMPYLPTRINRFSEPKIPEPYEE